MLIQEEKEMMLEFHDVLALRVDVPHGSPLSGVVRQGFHHICNFEEYFLKKLYE